MKRLSVSAMASERGCDCSCGCGCTCRCVCVTWSSEEVRRCWAHVDVKGKPAETLTFMVAFAVHSASKVVILKGSTI